MLFVFNKQKIYAYAISVFTVLVLFATAVVFQNNNSVQVVRTSSTADKLLPIYNVETNEKKVAFTINCAWSQ